MGYLLAGYLIIRSFLQKEIENQPKDERDILFWGSFNLGSIHQYIANIVVMGGLTTTPIKRFGREWWVALVPTSAIVFLAFGLSNFINAMAIYFVYDLSHPWPIEARFAGPITVGIVLILSLYVQFADAMRKRMGAWVGLIYLGFAVVVVTLAILVKVDPLRT